MRLVEQVTASVTGRCPEPVGTVHVVDPSPLNWLYITYNTVEELVRVNPAGHIEPAAMTDYRWGDIAAKGCPVDAPHRHIRLCGENRAALLGRLVRHLL